MRVFLPFDKQGNYGMDSSVSTRPRILVVYFRAQPRIKNSRKPIESEASCTVNAHKGSVCPFACPLSNIFRDVTRGLNQVLMNQVKKCAGTSGNSSVFPPTQVGKCANASGARQATQEVVAPDEKIPYQGKMESLNQPFIQITN